MHDLLRPADVALDLAAPVKRAIAPLHHDQLVGPMSASAAHDVATVHPERRVVADPTMRALDAELRVPLAEPRRRLPVDQILRAWRFVLRVVRFQLEAVLVVAPGDGGPAVATVVDAVREHAAVLVGRGLGGAVAAAVGALLAARVGAAAHRDAGRAVEAVLEGVADRAEGRQAHPAGFDRAGARHAVALALLAHLRLHVLKQRGAALERSDAAFGRRKETFIDINCL